MRWDFFGTSDGGQRVPPDLDFMGHENCQGRVCVNVNGEKTHILGPIGV